MQNIIDPNILLYNNTKSNKDLPNLTKHAPNLNRLAYSLKSKDNRHFKRTLSKDRYSLIKIAIKSHSEIDKTNINKPKEEHDIIKVRDCTYSNDFKKPTTYFFCQCSDKQLYPICVACAKSCHKEHSPTLQMEGIYECECGKDNHNVSEKNNETIFKRKNESSNRCVFSKFYVNNTLSTKGFYYVKSKIINEKKDNEKIISIIDNNNNNNNNNKKYEILCATCAEGCKNLKLMSLKKLSLIEEQQETDNNNLYCKCNQHYEFSIVNANLDFMSNYLYLERNILNLSLNTFLKINEINTMYFETINEFINKLNNKSIDTTSALKEYYQFFSNLNIIKSLDLFVFIKGKSSRYNHLSDNYVDLSLKDTIFKLISYKPLDLDNKDYEFCLTRINFSYFSFFSLIKNFYQKTNYNYSLSSVLNMDIVQRYVLFYNSNYFYKISNKYLENIRINKKLNTNKFSSDMYDEYANALNEQYEFAIDKNELISFKGKLYYNIYHIYCKIFRFLIKYNLISRNVSIKFFKLSLETIVNHFDVNNGYSLHWSIHENNLESLKYEDTKHNNITNDNNNDEINEDKQTNINNSLDSKEIIKEDKLENSNISNSRNENINNKVKKSSTFSSKDIERLIKNKKKDLTNTPKKSSKLKKMSFNVKSSRKRTSINEDHIYQNFNNDDDEEELNMDYTNNNEDNIESATLLHYNEINLMKCIFYYILHKNDYVFINRVTNKIDKYNNNYVFKSDVNNDHELVCKIFIIILNSFNKYKYPLRDVYVYDEYVKNILNILIGSNSNYKNNIDNTINLINDKISILTYNKNNIRKAIEQYILSKQYHSYNNKHETLKYIIEFVNTLSNSNYEYYSNDISFEEYINKNELELNALYTYTEKLFNIPKIEDNYYTIIHNNLSKEDFIKHCFDLNEDKSKIFNYIKIKTFQNLIEFSNIFDRLNQLFKIYSEGYAFINLDNVLFNTKSIKENNNNNINSKYNFISINTNIVKFNDKTLENTLHLIYLCIINNPSTACLFMNISPKYFVSCYLDYSSLSFLFFEFMNRFCENLFIKDSNVTHNNINNYYNFKFNNYDFLIGVFNQILLRINFLNDDDLIEKNYSDLINSNTNINSNNNDNDYKELEIENRTKSAMSKIAVNPTSTNNSNDKDKTYNNKNNKNKNNNKNTKPFTFRSSIASFDYDKSLYLLIELIKLVNVSFKAITYSNNFLLNIIQLIFDKLSNLKVCTKFEFEIKDIISSMKLSSFESKFTNKNPIIRKLILNYFTLLSSLFINDVYFYDIINENNMLISFNDLKEIYNKMTKDNFSENYTKESTINEYYSPDKNTNKYANEERNVILYDLTLLQEFNQLYNLYFFNFKTKYNNCKDVLTNLYTTNLPEEIESTSLSYILHKEKDKFNSDILIDYSNMLLKNNLIYSSFNNMLINNDNFNCYNLDTFIGITTDFNNNNIKDNFDKYINNNNHLIKNNSKIPIYIKKVLSIKFFEFSILRPFYYVINLYLLNEKHLQGNICFYLFKITFEFIKSVIKMYSFIFYLESSVIITSKDETTILINDIILNNNIIYDINNLITRPYISESIINEFKTIISSFINKEINYYEVHKLYPIATKILKLINNKLYKTDSSKNVSKTNRLINFNIGQSLNKLSFKGILGGMNSLVINARSFAKTSIIEKINDFNLSNIINKNNKNIDTNLIDNEEDKTNDYLTKNNNFKSLEMKSFPNTHAIDINKESYISNENFTKEDNINYIKNNDEKNQHSNNNSFNDIPEYASSDQYISYLSILETLNSTNRFKNKLIDIAKNYNNELLSLYENNLSLISILKHTDTDLDYYFEITKYVLKKLISNCFVFKEENLTGLFNYKKHNLNPDNFHNYSVCIFNSTLNKLFNHINISPNNFVYIEYLNNLLYHNSEQFQLQFENISETNNNFMYNFIYYLLTNIILPITLHKSLKTYDLLYNNLQSVKYDEDDTYNNNKKLMFLLGKHTIKLIQNLCEGHNKYFQTSIINFSITEQDIISKEYDYKPFTNTAIYDNYPKDEAISPSKNNYESKYVNLLKSKIQSNLNKYNVISSRKSLFNPLKLNANSTTENNTLDLKLKSKQGSNNKLNSYKRFEKLAEIYVNKTDKNNKNININKKDQNNTSNNKPFKKGFNFLKKKKTNNKYQNEYENEIKKLKLLRKNFINFIIINMKIIFNSLNLESKNILNKNNDMNNFSEIKELYQRLVDLVIEIIQGTEIKNFNVFYKKLPDQLRIFDNNNQTKLVNPDIKLVTEAFSFVQYVNQIKCVLYSHELEDIFNIQSIDLKINMFLIINNIISQEIPSDGHFVRMIISILHPEDLLDIIFKYLKSMFIKYILEIDIHTNNQEFINTFNDFEFNLNDLNELKEYYINNSDMYEDEYFKLSSQIFLFLSYIANKYDIAESLKILNLDEKSLIQHKQEDIISGNQTLSYQLKNLTAEKGIIFIFKKIFNFIFTVDIGFKDKYTKTKYNTLIEQNNYIITIEFFNYITKSVEFMIDSSNHDTNDLKMKKIYYIKDPKIEMISNSKIENFFKDADRTSSSSKLKYLINNVNFFLCEVDYKKENLKKSPSLKWMLEVDFKNVDFFNFIISIIINLILLFTMKGSHFKSSFSFSLVIYIVGFQLAINIVYLIIFMKAKYKFYVLVEKNKLENKKNKSLMNYLHIYVLDSVILNDEIYLIFLNMIIGSLAIFTEFSSFLFSLQLLSIIKFVSTIKEIVVAFKMRLSQLISMIGFLAILIFFYSNIGFYFLNDYFNTEIDNVSLFV